MSNNTNSAHFDAVVIGAGFSGLYMLHRLRRERRRRLLWLCDEQIIRTPVAINQGT